MVPCIFEKYIDLHRRNRAIGLFLAIIMAVLIDEFCHKKIAGVVRVAMYMPHICNIVAISVVWMACVLNTDPLHN